MGVLNPLFLWLLPLAALPVVFHLFLRVRKRTRPFSTLMFFERADPRLSARKKLREWLALVLRVLCILLLLSALARPVVRGWGGGGDVNAVLLVDNSASMSGRGVADRTKLEHALDAASAFASGLRANDAASVVLLVADPGVPLPEGPVSEPEALRTVVDRIGETEAEGAPARALRDALDRVEAGSAARRELHIFSDFQHNEWGRVPSGEALRSSMAAVLAHRIGSVPLGSGNLSVADISLPERRIVAGRPTAGTVAVRNPTREDGGGRLNTGDDTDARSSRALQVPPGETRFVPVRLEPLAAGLHWLHVWIEDDGFSADNQAYTAYVASERETVLLVGAPEDFALLPAALSPAGDGALSGLRPVFRAPVELDAALRQEQPVMVVSTWRGVESGAATEPLLKAYVEEGGVLLLLPAMAGGFTGAAAEWTGGRLAPAVTPGAGESVTFYEQEEDVWRDLKDPKGEIILRRVRVFRGHPVALSAGARPLALLPDGRPILTERRLGGGVVFGCGVALDAGWSNLPLRSGVLALVQGLALLRPPPMGDVISLAAGEALSGPRFDSEALRVKALAGATLEWQGHGADFGVFARAGVYSVESGEDRFHVAVRAAAGEGRDRYVPGETIPALGGLEHRVLAYRDAESLTRTIARLRSGVDLFLPLLLLSLAAALGEGWIVNPVARGAGAGLFSPRCGAPEGGSRGMV